MSFEYLKEKQHYNNLYDLSTIKQCLNVLQFWKEIYQNKDSDKKLKAIPPEEVEKGINYYFSWDLRATKGERYRLRSETIQKWISRDKAKQDKLDNAYPPENIFCDKCNELMYAENYKNLEEYDNKPRRVLFFLECPKCKKRKGIYDDGEEYISKSKVCPRCGKEVKTMFIEKNQVSTTTTKCTSCAYKETDVHDWGKRRLEREAEEKSDKELLEKYRGEFCISDKEGEEYIDLMNALEVAKVVREEETHKYDSFAYQRSLQLKKITIHELEGRLKKKLENAQYVKLTFDKPDIGQNIMVPFTVQDANPSRKDRASTSELEKIITNTLEDTNWRLVSSSVVYRLGYLKGQLKGYESEEDMLKLAGKKEGQKQKPLIDEAKRNKYLHHSVVNLARVLGKSDGIENMRKRRLVKEPEGFYLEDSGSSYSCGICGEDHPGNEIWWREEGIFCADCWRNIKEMIIPLLGYDHRNKVWIKEWQIQSDYNIHPMTAKKMRRLGELVGRELKRKDGTIYYTVYLLSENKNFLEKYPKRPEKDIKITWSDEHQSMMLKVKKNEYQKDTQG